MFVDNFAKRFADVGDSVQAAGPPLTPAAPWRVVLITVLPVVAQGYADARPRARS